MEDFAKVWQKKIIAQCELKLGRPLSSAERTFIQSRAGGIALEFIQDTVNSLEGSELTRYLNSENQK